MTPWPSGTCAMPALAMWSGRRLVRLTSSSSTWPLRVRTKPEMVRSSVVLPAPFAPRTAVIVPALAVMDTPFSTGVLPYPATSSAMVSDAASVIGPLLLIRRQGWLGLGCQALRRHGVGAEIGRGDRRVRLHFGRRS